MSINYKDMFQYDGILISSWTGGSVPLLSFYASLCITTAQRRQSTNFSNGPRILQSINITSVCALSC